MVRQNWVLYKGLVSAATCDHIIKDLDGLPFEEANTFNKGDKSIRSSRVKWIVDHVDLKAFCMRFVNQANAEAFNVDIQQDMTEMQFTEYQASEGGHYSWHHDVDWQNIKNFDRKLSIVIQLSSPDDYEGGEFQFSECESPKSEEFKMKGSVLVFPSYLQHQVTEVTEGTRYSLVSWVRGPRWR